jgi:hypothetical protein
VKGADLLAHVHASARQLGAVGPEGPVGHDKIAAALPDVGYDGQVSVQMLAQPEDALGAVEEAAAYVRETYR